MDEKEAGRHKVCEQSVENLEEGYAGTTHYLVAVSN